MSRTMRNAALAFVAGCLVGAAAVWIPESGRPRTVAASELAAASSAAQSEEASESTALLETEPSSMPANARSTPESIPPTSASRGAGELSALEAFLLELHRDGSIETQQLLSLVVPALASRGRTDDALELLALVPSSELGSIYLQIVNRLDVPYQPDLRTFWIERALASRAWSLDFIACIAADRALVEMDALVASNGGTVPRGIESLYMNTLASNGRKEEALVLARSVLARDPHDETALEVLELVDVQAAVDHYQNLIERHDEQGDWRRALFELCVANDRLQEASDALRALETSQSRVEADDWCDLAEHYFDSGDEERAVDCWSRALRLETGEPDSWDEALREHAPAQLLALLEERVQQPVSDEIWGALGDARWFANRRDDALAAWETAMRLDPGDEEWSEKLEMVATGRDPLDY